MDPTRPWLPEFPVDEALAARLIARLMPSLAGRRPVRVGEGWDNDVWRVDDWTFRFPRRPMAVDLLRIEARVLPALAPHLPLPVPAAVCIGEPSPAHPAPYLAHRFLPGVTLDRARLGDADRARLAPAIGACLKALHGIPRALAEAVGAPVDTHKRDAEARRRMIRERLPRLGGTRYAAHLPAAARWLDTIDLPSGAMRCVCHGDLYARHLLVEVAADGTPGALCGVIDWGDVMISDPGIDLSIAYGFVPPAARPAFFAAYGPVDPASDALARITALHYGVALALYGLDVGDAALADEADHTLRFALTSAPGE